LQIELHARASFRVREPGAALACLQDRSGMHGELVYAAPMPDGREYAIGLGTEHEPPVDEALSRLRGYVERGMPGLDPEAAGVRLCRTSILAWGADAFAVWRVGAIDVLAAPTSSSSPRSSASCSPKARTSCRPSVSSAAPRRPRARAADPARTSATGASAASTAKITASTGAPAANSAATPDPNTANSINTRTGSTVGCDAFGDMNRPHTTATSSGAPSR
jgi:hypothetical protein